MTSKTLKTPSLAEERPPTTQNIFIARTPVSPSRPTTRFRRTNRLQQLLLSADGHRDRSANIRASKVLQAYSSTAAGEEPRLRSVEGQPVIKQLVRRQKQSLFAIRAQLDQIQLKNKTLQAEVHHRQEVAQRQSMELEVERLKKILQRQVEKQKNLKQRLQKAQIENSTLHKMEEDRYDNLLVIKNLIQYQKQFIHELELGLSRGISDQKFLDAQIANKKNLLAEFNKTWQIPEAIRYDLEGDLQQLEDIDFAINFNAFQKQRITRDIQKIKEDRRACDQSAAKRRQDELQNRCKEERQEIEKLKKHLGQFDRLKKAVKISKSKKIVQYRQSLKVSKEGSHQLVKEALGVLQRKQKQIEQKKAELEQILSSQLQKEECRVSELDLQERLIKEGERYQTADQMRASTSLRIALILNTIERLNKLAHLFPRVELREVQKQISKAAQNLHSMGEQVKRKLELSQVPSYKFISESQDIFHKVVEELQDHND